MPKAIRDVYGETLLELGAENENIVALDADLAGSTRSGKFGKAYPDRFFDMGIAESNMVSTAAGLATTGKIPYVNTFTAFLSTLGLIAVRAQVCYGNLNVKLGGGYGGVSAAYDGATHHALEDIAVMRTLPRMRVIVPSDPASTRWATRKAAEIWGPVYLRLSRDVYPDLYDENTKFEIGRGAIVREGVDVTVIACGIQVHKALEAAERFAQQGVSVRVVDMYSIKPIDKELILRCAKETGAIVCAEEHNIHGGLGGAVAEVLAWGGAGVPTEFVGTMDTFTESGSYKELLVKYGLDTDGVAAGIERALARVKSMR
jgi:transketolase